MLEVMAMISMLIDHIGYIFYPEERYLRYIGRLAFPIYVYSLIQGYKYTKSHKRYMLRLLSIALLSQIPYSLAFISYQLNVVFTLLIGLVILWVLDYQKWFISVPICIALSAISQLSDYGIYGILLVLIYRFGNRFVMILFHFILNCFFVFYLDWAKSQLYSIIGTIIVVVSPYLYQVKIHRTFYRSFYPVHLLVLFISELIIYGERYIQYAKRVLFGIE